MKLKNALERNRLRRLQNTLRLLEFDGREGSRIYMVDRGIQLVREWLQRQPFSLRLLTLILFLVEAVEEECGEEMKTKFENDLREVLCKLPLNRARENNMSHAPGPCWCGRDHTVPESMLYRARDLFRDDCRLTTERVAHTLVMEYSDLAKEFGVTPETLHKESSEIACRVAETLGLMAKWRVEEKGPADDRLAR